MKPLIDQLINELAAMAPVQAVLLGGSRAAGLAEAGSDYDLYVYGDPVPLALRRQQLGPLFAQVEWNNRFWETEDDGVLTDGSEVELIYRSFDFIESMVAATVEQHQAWVGYTGCFWANLQGSRILFDRHGQAVALQRRFAVPYPEALREAVVRKNFPLLRGALPAYRRQLAKALARQDGVSVNHRLAAWLASYFDILFAVNRLPHPGEKRLLQHLAALPSRPAGACEEVQVLLALGHADPALPQQLDRLTDALAVWLTGQGLAHCLD